MILQHHPLWNIKTPKHKYRKFTDVQKEAYKVRFSVPHAPAKLIIEYFKTTSERIKLGQDTNDIEFMIFQVQ